MDKYQVAVLVEIDLNVFLHQQFSRRKWNKEIATAYTKAKEDLKLEGYLDKDYELTVQGKHQLGRIYG